MIETGSRLGILSGFVLLACTCLALDSCGDVALAHEAFLDEVRAKLPNPGVLCFPETPLSDYRFIGDGGAAEFTVVPVEDQPFSHAVRVAVAGPQQPVWNVQMMTPPSTEDLSSDDVLLFVSHVRSLDSRSGRRSPRDFYTAVFSHPATEAITCWGFWEGQMWRPGAAWFRTDWSLKPAAQAYIDLVLGEWWTDVSGRTDAEGEFRVNGFLGDYEVTVTSAGQEATTHLRLERAGTTRTVQLQARRDRSDQPRSRRIDRPRSGKASRPIR